MYVADKENNKLEYVLSYDDDRTIIVANNKGIVDNVQDALKMHSKLDRFGMNYSGMSFHKYDYPVIVHKNENSFSGVIFGTEVFTVNMSDDDICEEVYITLDDKKYFILENNSSTMMVEVEKESGVDFNEKLRGLLESIGIFGNEIDFRIFEYQNHFKTTGLQQEYIQNAEGEKINIETLFTIKARYTNIALSSWGKDKLEDIPEPWFLMYVALNRIRPDNNSGSD